MEALTALVAGLLAELHLLTADAVCPGGWPWAVSLMGVAVGLLPAAGTAAVAIWRRRIGSRYGPAESVVLVGVGVLACGVLPLLVFLATGRVFAAAAGSGPVPGLTSRQLRDLDSAVCVVGAQSTYLGRGSVAAAFGADSSLRTGLALLALIGAAGGGGAVHGGVGAAGAAARAAVARAVLLAAGARGGGADDGRARGVGGAPVARRLGGGVPRDAGGAVAGRAGVGGGAPVAGRSAAGSRRAVRAGRPGAVRLRGSGGRHGHAAPDGRARRPARGAVRRPRPRAGGGVAPGVRSGRAAPAAPGRWRAHTDPGRPRR